MDCRAVLLLLLLCTSLCAAQTPGTQLKIPRVIHRNYMSGAAALQAATVGPQPDFKAHWLASCTVHNPGWQEVIWDEAAVLRLIQEDFPWFLDTYLSYPRLVQRSDVMRYMALYKYGGVYLDADVECYTSMEESLQDQDLVLSCEEPGAWGQLHNAAMASTAGHPFWLAVLQLAMQRSPAAVAGNSSWLQLQAWKLWRRTPFFDGLLDVLRTTGPILLTDVYRVHTGGAPACGYRLTLDGRMSTAYPVGSWYTPCLCADDECLRFWNVQHFKLVEQQAQGHSTQLATTALQKQVKFHAGRERRQRLRWQKQLTRQALAQQQGRVSVRKLTPQQQMVVGIHQYSASWTGWDQSHKLLQQQRMRAEMSQHVVDYLAFSASSLQHAPSSSTGPPLASGAAAAAAPAPAPASSTDAGKGAADAALLQHMHQALVGAEPAGAPCSLLMVVGSGAAQQGSMVTASSQDNSSTASSCVGNLQCGPSYTYTQQGQAADAQAAVALLLEGPDTERAAADDVQQDSMWLDQLAEQLGCKSKVVAASNWLLQPGQHDSLQTSHSGSTTRHILWFPSSGDDLPALHELLSLPWDTRSALAQVRILFVDVTLPSSNCSSNDSGHRNSCAQLSLADTSSNSASNTSSSTSSSTSRNVTGWDDLYNLLHQQLGFKGFWRQQLDSNTLRLGWVRQPMPAHAQMQEPHSSHAAAALHAAAAHTPASKVQRGVCNCCGTCCGRGSTSNGGCPLWQQVACLLGVTRGDKQCVVLAAAQATIRASSKNSSSTEGAPGTGSSCNAGSCLACCRCKPSLWGLLQSKAQEDDSSIDGSSNLAGSSVGALPMLAAWSVTVACGFILHQLLRLPARGQPTPRLKQA